jgi:IstB-like ATP binding protein
VPDQLVQGLQTIHVKDRRSGLSHRPKDIGGIRPDRARAAIGQLHHQEDDAVQPFEPPGREQPTEQRMRRDRHPHLARQNSTKMLQSVGVTVGTGKTHLATALAAAACQRGIPARYFTTSSLVAQLRRAKDAGRLDKELTALAKNQLTVIDELGYLPIDADGARLLFQVIVDAYEQRSLIITTNLEFSRWGTVFGDDNMAAAIIDRIVHHGRLLQFRGDSYRVGHALMK